MGREVNAWAAALVVLAAMPAWAADDTCVNTTIAGDRDIWESNRFMRETWYRDFVAQFYNLQQSEWDESWGWLKYNDADGHRWEFVKMMSVAKLISAGTDAGPFTQGAWGLDWFNSSVGRARPKLAVVSRTPDTVDIFFRDSDGKLRHGALSGSPWLADSSAPANTQSVVSDLVATSKDGFTIVSDPVAVTRDAESMDVFAIDRNRHLLHFAWTAGGGWAVNNLTLAFARPASVNGSDRYFVDSNLTGIRRSGTAMEVFATDRFGHLVHFGWELGVWSVTDLTHRLGAGVFRVRDGVAVARRDERESLVVVARKDSRKLVLFSWTNEDGWTGEDLGPVLAEGNRSVDSQPALVLPNAVSIFIYYRSNYTWYLAAKLPLLGWHEIDLTESSYAVEGNPVAIKHGTHAVDAFIRDGNGQLIHNAFRPQVFETRNLSAIGNFPRIRSDPVAIASGGGRADVFAHSFGDHLAHYWSSGEEWSAEDLLASPRITNALTTTGGIYPVRRRESALDVFTGVPPGTGNTAHFYSMFGRATSPWHTGAEYANWAAGSLHGFSYDPEDSYDEIADAYGGIFGGWVRMFCPAFHAVPAKRAAIMLHEATHIVYWDFPHQDNRTADICGGEPCSDDWFWHGAGAPGGTLGSATRNHSMNQVEVEFQCDLAQFARFDLSLNASFGALAYSNETLDLMILNPPGWRCGLPRPLQ
jgi:hypothetical protein